MPNKTVLSAHLWDLRASVEAQLRCLTEIQRRLDEFQKAAEASKRSLATKILHELNDVQQNNVTIAHSVEYTIEQAHTELGIERLKKSRA